MSYSRRTSQAAPASTTRHSHGTDHHRYGGNPHVHRVQPYPSSRGRPGSFRNRSLVLNGSGTQTPPSDSSTPEASASTGSSWVYKTTPGQRSLINPAVYEKNEEATAKAIEATRQKKMLQQDAREKNKLATHLQRFAGYPSAPGTPTNSTPVGQHEVEIQGLRYRVAHNGSKLIKVSGGKDWWSSIQTEGHTLISQQETFTPSVQRPKSPSSVVSSSTEARLATSIALVCSERNGMCPALLPSSY